MVFKDYLLEEFKIANYVVKMPTSNSSYLEKCRAITPEIDNNKDIKTIPILYRRWRNRPRIASNLFITYVL